MDTIKFAAVSRNYFNMPIWIAQHAGFLEDERIDIAIELHEGIDEVTNRLRDGRVQLAFGVTENVILNSEAGGNLEIIGGNVNKLPFSFIARKGISSFEQLRGKTVGVSSIEAGSSSLVMQMLADQGLRYPEDYRLRAVGPILTRWKMLQSGEIDAGLQGGAAQLHCHRPGICGIGRLARSLPRFSIHLAQRRCAMGEAKPGSAGSLHARLRQSSCLVQYASLGGQRDRRSRDRSRARLCRARLGRIRPGSYLSERWRREYRCGAGSNRYQRIDSGYPIPVQDDRGRIHQSGVFTRRMGRHRACRADSGRMSAIDRRSVDISLNRIDYGDRLRIGVLLPSGNAVAESELRAMLPPGVSLHVTRLPLRGSSEPELMRMIEGLETASRLLADARVDFIVFHCTAVSTFASHLAGEICARIESATGIPSAATADALVAALRALQATRLSLLTPYIDAVHWRENAFLTRQGFTVTSHANLGIDGNAEMARLPPLRIADWVLGHDHRDAEACFVSCTAIRSAGTIEALERELGLPVITSNQAMVWHVLERRGIAERVGGFGRLMRQPIRERI